MEETCPICWDTYNRSSNKRITCIHCNRSACKGCMEKSIIEDLSKNNEPKCTNPECLKTWSKDFLREEFTNIFFKKIESLQVEEEFNNRRGEILAPYQVFAKEYLEMKNKYGSIESITESMKEIDEIIAPLRSKKDKLFQIYLNMKSLKRGENPYSENNENVQFEQRNKMCSKDDCRGFLNEEFICELCGGKTCKECYTNESEEHVCDKDQIKSVNEIRKLSKDCPNCGIQIERKSGCSEMFCTNCKKGWDWNTEKVLNRPLHNPEYFDWVNKNISSINIFSEQNCRRMPSYPSVRKNYGYDFGEVMRIIEHINEVMRVEWSNKSVNNKIYYIGYLTGEISKKVLIKRMIKARNAERRNNEIEQILVTFYDCCVDIFNYLVHKPSEQKRIRGKEMLNELKNRTNITFKELENKYKLTTPRIEFKLA